MGQSKETKELKCRVCTHVAPNISRLKTHVINAHPELGARMEAAGKDSVGKIRSAFTAVPKDHEWAPRANRSVDDEESSS